MNPDSTEPYGPAARRELLRRLGREDSNLYHVLGRLRDAEETGAMTAGHADQAIAAARASHERWTRIIRQTWQAQQDAAVHRQEAARAPGATAAAQSTAGR